MSAFSRHRAALDRPDFPRLCFISVANIIGEEFGANVTGREKIKARHILVRRLRMGIFGGLLGGAFIAIFLDANKWVALSFLISLQLLLIIDIHFILAIIYACPNCGNRLSPRTIYGDGRLLVFRLPKNVRFCPCCGLDFDKELPRP